MQFITALFGGIDSTYVNSAFALGLVLVMIVLGVWLLKMFTRASSTINRGRNRRLSVVDSAMVDGRRQVLIIRRDNVEHLIMTGGPQDLVIESGIAASDPAAPLRPSRPQVRTATAETPVRPGEAPAAPERQPPREALDRMRDLARPASLRPGGSLRHTGLMRPSPRQDSAVIPIAPAVPVDNSTGAAADSATSGGVSGTGGRTRVDGKSRFFRGGIRDDRT